MIGNNLFFLPLKKPPGMLKTSNNIFHILKMNLGFCGSFFCVERGKKIVGQNLPSVWQKELIISLQVLRREIPA